MIIYRTAGAWGPGAGANLQPQQVDGNFWDLQQRLRDLEINGVKPVEIATFTVAGNQFYVHMSDGTVHGPFFLPETRWFFRGQWTPSTVYAVDDVITGPDAAVYLVIFAHVSGTAFGPNANDGQGHQFYSLLLSSPAAMLPTGGAPGYVLTKNTQNNYDVKWAQVPVPPGGDQGSVLRKFSENDGDADWDFLRIDDMFDVLLGGLGNGLRDGDYLRWSSFLGQWTNQPRPIFNVVTATSWAPVVGDEGSFMVLTNGTTATSIIIPNNTTQGFAIGSELHIHQDGTGPVTVIAEGGVTILKHASFTNQLLGQYATATVKKTATNVWRLFGLLAGV